MRGLIFYTDNPIVFFVGSVNQFFLKQFKTTFLGAAI